MPVDVNNAISAGTGLLGIGLNAMGVKGQMQNQKDLMEQQMQNQMNLNLQSQKIQQENWDYTNYENQRKHIENAGLNVGLLYGMGGSGGSSMGSSGGSAAGGNAPQNNAPQIMAQMLQSQMTQSQIELNKAQANKLEVEAQKMSGVDTAQIQAETTKKLTETESIKLDNALKSNNLTTYTETAKEILTKTQLENNNLVNQNKITKVEADNAITNIKLDLITKGLNNELTRAKTDQTSQLTEQSKNEILQKWETIKQQARNLDQQEQKILIEKFKANVTSEYPSIMNTTGKALNDMLTWWSDLTTGGQTHARQIK